MSTWPVPSAMDPSTQTFPVLTAAHLERVRANSKIRKVEAGKSCSSREICKIPFFALLSGRLEIVQPGIHGRLPSLLTAPASLPAKSHDFRTTCFVLGRVSEPGEFCEMTVETLRALIARDAELSEIFMRAFILRRVALITHNLGNVILMDRATLRLPFVYANS